MKTEDMQELNTPEYSATDEPNLVELKPVTYLAIEGMGAPDGEQFSRRLSALSEVYTALRNQLESAGNSIESAYLEALWWGVSGPGDFSSDPSSDWAWKLMYRVPDLLNRQDLNRVISELQENSTYSEVAKVFLDSVDEGLSVQVLHTGPYVNEQISIEKMSKFVQERELSFHGLHHEIYLNRPKEVPSEELKTILRMPVC